MGRLWPSRAPQKCSSAALRRCSSRLVPAPGPRSQRGGWEQNGTVPAPCDRGTVWNAQHQKSDKDHQHSKDPGNDHADTHLPEEGGNPSLDNSSPSLYEVQYFLCNAAGYWGRDLDFTAVRCELENRGIGLVWGVKFTLKECCVIWMLSCTCSSDTVVIL